MDILVAYQVGSELIRATYPIALPSPARSSIWSTSRYLHRRKAAIDFFDRSVKAAVKRAALSISWTRSEREAAPSRTRARERGALKLPAYSSNAEGEPHRKWFIPARFAINLRSAIDFNVTIILGRLRSANDFACLFLLQQPRCCYFSRLRR